MSQVPTSRVRAGRIRTAVLALLALTATTALASGSAQAAPRSFYGLVPNQDLRAADYQLIRKAKVGSARVALFWQVIEAGNNQFNWSATDRLIGGLAASKVRALPLLFGTPAWLADDPARPPTSKQQRAEWRQFVAEAVKRYGKGGTYWTSVYPAQFPGAKPRPVKAWQVWNEVNGPRHFLPKPKVGKYAKLLKDAKKSIKQNDRKADVVTAGLVSKPTGKGGIKGWKYLKKLLKKKKAKRSIDHAALHPYAGNNRKIVKDVKKMRRALKKRGKKKAGLWITEVGWSSKKGKSKLAKSPKKQAKLLKKTYKQLAKKRKKWKIGGVYWYTWRDIEERICRWCPDAGLVKKNLKPKKSYRKYKQVAR